jgi:hypothetical protein
LIDALLAFLRLQTDSKDTAWLSLIADCWSIINMGVQDEHAARDDLLSLLSRIFAWGVLIRGVKSPRNLMVFDFSSIEVLFAEQLPNYMVIPSKVRSMAAITLGKLCLVQQDIAWPRVSIFVQQLQTSDDSP